MPSSEKKKQADRARYQANPRKKIEQVTIKRQLKQQLNTIAASQMDHNLTLVPGGSTQVAETPAAETPAAETPAAETPAAETPAAETPAAETPAAETPAAETPAAETQTAETQTAETIATKQGNRKRNWSGILLACGIGTRTAFVAGLAFLQALLQIEFYAAHDILPGFRVALAFACELSLISIPSMKGSKTFAIVRWIVWSLLFGYIVAAQGYHVYSGMRAQNQHSVAHAQVSSSSDLAKKLNDEKISKETYERKGAWDLVRDARKEIQRLESQIESLPARKTFGISDEDLAQIGTWLIILIRALLPIVCALNVVKLRNDYQSIIRS